MRSSTRVLSQTGSKQKNPYAGCLTIQGSFSQGVPKIRCSPPTKVTSAFCALEALSYTGLPPQSGDTAVSALPCIAIIGMVILAKPALSNRYEWLDIGIIAVTRGSPIDGHSPWGMGSRPARAAISASFGTSDVQKSVFGSSLGSCAQRALKAARSYCAPAIASAV